MIVVAVALVAALALTVALGSGLLRSQQRAHARREDLLLNQLLHAAGKPWLPAPADEPAPPVEPAEREAPRFSTEPEVLTY